MISIIKVTVNHMKSHIGRGLMILFSIMLSAGLVYAVLNMSLITEGVFKNNFLKDYGTANVLIYNENNELLDGEIPAIANSEYQIPTNTLVGYADLDSKYVVNMNSYTESEFMTVYDVEYLDKLDEPMSRYHIIIGEENHILHDLDIGDTMEVTLNGDNYSFIIYGIVEEGKTYLDYNPNIIDIVISKDFVANELLISKPNTYMIKLYDISEVDALVETYAEYKVLDLLHNELYLEGFKMTSSLLTLMASSVVLISAFIIFSTYKIIVIERLPFLGTLRSIGANKSFGTRALIMESVIYGFIGGILGIFTGFALLYAIFEVFFSIVGVDMVGVQYFNPLYALFTLLIAIIISVCSSIVPIFKTRKYTIKQVMFGEIKNIKEMKYRNSIIGVSLIVLAIILIINRTYKTDVLFSLSGLLLVVIGCVLLVPLLILVIAPIISYLMYPFFGNKTLISCKNIRHDKTLINNIVLLAVGLGVIFMINNFSRSVGEIVDDVYGEANFDLVISSVNVPDELIDDIVQLDGVTNVYTVRERMNIETVEGYKLPFMIGIDLIDYHEYAWNDFGPKINDNLINNFNGKTVIITNLTSSKYDLEIGDSYQVEYNDEIHDLEVIEIVSSVLYNGNLNFISNTTFDDIYGEDAMKSIYIETSEDVTIMKNNIKELYMYGVLPVESLDDMEKTNQDTNKMIFSMMISVSFLAMLIGAIGIINNFTVSFISRRQLIASLRSLGLSIKGTIKLFMVESLITGIIGSTIGVVFGIVFFKTCSYVIEALGITSEVMSYSIYEMVFVFVSGIVISLLAALLPAWNISKRNIVKELKYEG